MTTPRRRQTDPRRGTAAYKAHRARQRALKLPCWLCRKPINYDAPRYDRWSFSLDHVIPLSRGGSLLDPDNARSAHYGCNASRGAKLLNQPAPPVRAQSRQW